MEQLEKLSVIAEEISNSENKENQTFLIIAHDETEDGKGKSIGLVKGMDSSLVASICVAIDGEPALLNVLERAIQVHKLSKMLENGKF